jgi:acyl carrier protein
MQPDEITERAIQVIHRTAPHIAKAELEPAGLSDDLGLNSLQTVEVILALEKEFGIDIQNSDASKLRSASDIVAVVVQRMGTAKTE